jgi:succinate dehydrogenase / fumarate reductase flavoprotein subunit
MARNRDGLEEALRRIPEIRAEFWENVIVPGSGAAANPELEKAGRVADFMEFAELLCRDALDREESCGGHFREEHQFSDGEAKRDDDNFCYVSAYEYSGDLSKPILHKEHLNFEEVHLSVRSYK